MVDHGFVAHPIGIKCSICALAPSLSAIRDVLAAMNEIEINDYVSRDMRSIVRQWRVKLEAALPTSV